MVRASAPKPWEERYRHQGRLWGGDRLDAWTAAFIEADIDPDEQESDRPMRWLDAACGDGKGLVPLSRRLAPGSSVVGVDLARQALRLIDPASTNGLVQGDLRALPFRAASFDRLRAVHAVGHLMADDRRRAWRGLRALAADDARLLVTEFGTSDMRANKGDEVEPGTMRRDPGILTHYYGRDEIVVEIEAGGWSVDRCEVVAHPFKVRGVELPRERVCVVARA